VLAQARGTRPARSIEPGPRPWLAVPRWLAAGLALQNLREQLSRMGLGPDDLA